MVWREPKNSMPTRISRFANSVKQLGEIQVNEWDFMGLLHRDIRDIEFTRSLRKLGSIQVMEWDFRNVLPAVNRLAHQEVDFARLLRRAAHHKIMDWDFRSALHPDASAAPQAAAQVTESRLPPEEMRELTDRLRAFLQFVAVPLIDDPGHARIMVQEISPNVLRFKLVLVRKDVAMLIGREGHTASAIRSILKATASARGVHALLEIHSHEEEAAQAPG
jgi:predicted RNA-binding protein YlqC (UPF0109 family)